MLINKCCTPQETIYNHSVMKTQLTPAQCAFIRDQIEPEGHAIYQRYSGRAMYGRECFGIVIDSNSDTMLFHVAFNLGMNAINHPDAEIQELCEIFGSRVCSDNLGRDMIYYFPSVQWCEEQPASEEEAEDEEQEEDLTSSYS